VEGTSTDQADRLINNGTVRGNVNLESGADLYQGLGLVTGSVFGKAGNDTLADGGKDRGTSSCPAIRRSRLPACGLTTGSSTSRAAPSLPCRPATRCSRFHDRRPVILDAGHYDAWLDPATPAAVVKPLLARNLDGDLQFHRVGRTVNSVKKQEGNRLSAFGLRQFCHNPQK